MTSKPLFSFYEEVRVESNSPPHNIHNRRIGVIMGMTATDDGDTWYYTEQKRCQEPFYKKVPDTFDSDTFDSDTFDSDTFDSATFDSA